MSIAAMECVFFLGVEASKEQMISLLNELDKSYPIDSNKLFDEFDDVHVLLSGLDETKLSNDYVKPDYNDEYGWFINCETLEQNMIAYILMESVGLYKVDEFEQLLSTSVKRYSLLRKKKYSKASLHLRAARECTKNAGALYDYRSFIELTRKITLSLEEAISLLTGCDADSNAHCFYEEDLGSPNSFGLQIVYFATDRVMSIAKKNGFESTVHLTTFLRWAKDQQLLFDDYLLDKIKVTRGKDEGLFAEALIKGFFSMEEIQTKGAVKNSVLKHRVRGKELNGYGPICYDDGKYESKLTEVVVTVATINRKIRTLRNDKKN